MTNMLVGVMTNLCMFATNFAVYSVNINHLDELRLQQGGRIVKMVETKVIVTNTVQSDNSSGCRTCFARGSGSGPIVTLFRTTDHVYCNPYVPATEKFETTIILEIKTLKFTWDGVEQKLESNKVLDEKVRKWKKAEEWEEVK